MLTCKAFYCIFYSDTEPQLVGVYMSISGPGGFLFEEFQDSVREHLGRDMGFHDHTTAAMALGGGAFEFEAEGEINGKPVSIVAAWDGDGWRVWCLDPSIDDLNKGERRYHIDLSVAVKKFSQELRSSLSQH